VEVALGDLFASPVLTDFGCCVETDGRAELPSLASVERGERLALSYAQERLWFLSQMEGPSEAYHIHLALRLTGDLDRPALRQALDRIVLRHEALRTTFSQIDGEPHQRIGSEGEIRFHLLEHDLRERVNAECELKRLMTEESRGRFDLEKGPLIRGRLIRRSEDTHTLLITIHHLVSDAWSIGVLTTELSALYSACRDGEADPLPLLRVQYADYAAWQRSCMARDILKQQTDYWQATLAGALPLDMPTDHPRPAQHDFAGDFV